MSDPTIEGLKALRAATLQRLQANADYVAVQVLDEAIAKLEGPVSGPDLLADAVRSLTGNSLLEVAAAKRNLLAAAAPRWRFNAPERLSISDSAEAVLNATGQPLSLNELLNVMEMSGFVENTDESTAASVSSMLSRDTRFRSVAWKNRRRWWLSSKPIPEDEGGRDET